jgi:two-component sensor histidine kinase/tetratricopeptide (TPR) repeat protein
MFKTPFYILGFLLILISGVSAYGQTSEQLAQLKKADSLSQFNFQKSLEVINPLIEELSDRSKKEKNFKTKALQIKGHSLEELNYLEEALPILLNVIERSNTLELIETKYLAYISIALVHEKNGDLKESKPYLDYAASLHSQHDLKKWYALYCVRTSSFFRISGQMDSAKIYAEKALEYAVLFKDKKQELDGHVLLGHLSGKEASIAHYSAAAHLCIDNNDLQTAAYMFDNIAVIYLRDKDLSNGFTFNDSALIYSMEAGEPLIPYTYETRGLLFEELNQLDSALVYFKLSMDAQVKKWENSKNSEITKIQWVYDVDKEKEKVRHQEDINAKQEQLIYVWAALFAVVAATFVLLFFAYRNLKAKNTEISQQAEQLEVTVNQKEVLLAEVQHRVKNNLQLIIGLLEIQKEKAAFTPIDELMTESQNRIMSLSFLHNKLKYKSGKDYVNFESYLQEITHLLDNSFAGLNKKIEFVLNSKTDDITIDEAISLGLIVVELINNSMKHAFKNQTNGEIKIGLTSRSSSNKKRVLTYQDNGTGYNPGKNQTQGTGLEIIHGLVKQVHGEIEMMNENGFKAIMKF